MGYMFAECRLLIGDSFILNIVDSSEDSYVGQTLKRPLSTSQPSDEQTYSRKEDIKYGSRFGIDEESSRRVVPEYNGAQISSLMLEVIAGSSKGIRSSIHFTNTQKLPLTLGRVLPSDVLVKDSEVSGKHAHINWNINVQITNQNEILLPFGVGTEFDPMAMRRGGKKLPMEDVCYYQWPLPETDQVS